MDRLSLFISIAIVVISLTYAIIPVVEKYSLQIKLVCYAEPCLAFLMEEDKVVWKVGEGMSHDYFYFHDKSKIEVMQACAEVRALKVDDNSRYDKYLLRGIAVFVAIVLIGILVIVL